VQSCVQVPQCVGSEARLTQLEPQTSGVGAMQLDEHIGCPPVAEHSPSGAVHRLLQLPQVAGRVRSVSHPSLGLVEQWPNPLTQPEGWMLQAPLTHWTAGGIDPAFTLVSLLQSKLQAPQFW
jgi:hypothetical protein